MRIISTKKLPNGNVRMTVEMKPSEQFQVFDEEGHYRLGDPLNDIVAGHILQNAEPVVWCSVSQQWV